MRWYKGTGVRTRSPTPAGHGPGPNSLMKREASSKVEHNASLLLEIEMVMVGAAGIEGGLAAGANTVAA